MYNLIVGCQDVIDFEKTVGAFLREEQVSVLLGIIEFDLGRHILNQRMKKKVRENFLGSVIL